MEQTIKVAIRSLYGKENIYPICETAMLLTRLARTTTITPGALKIIQKLGYKVEVQAPRLPGEESAA